MLDIMGFKMGYYKVELELTQDRTQRTHIRPGPMLERSKLG